MALWVELAVRLISGKTTQPPVKNYI